MYGPLYGPYASVLYEPFGYAMHVFLKVKNPFGLVGTITIKLEPLHKNKLEQKSTPW